MGTLINQQIVCMSGSTSAGRLTINCPTDQTIHIFSAYFGIQSDTVTQCVTAPNTNLTEISMCFDKVVYENINSTCENMQSCSLDVRVSNLGDPCLLHNKQLFLQYQCVDYENFTSLVSDCESNDNYGRTFFLFIKCSQIN